MHHIIFGQETGHYPIALLIKSAAFNQHELTNAFINPMVKGGLSVDDVIGFTLAYDNKGKAPVKFIRNYLANLLPALKSLGCQYLYCADANYFKVLTGQRKAEPHLGYVLPCKIEGFEDLQVILGVNHKSLLYDPKNEAKLNLSLDALINKVNGSYKPLGEDLIHFVEYPDNEKDIGRWLEKLHDYQTLTVDIETFSLRFNKAGIATITFCWGEHEGIAFKVDYEPFAPNATYLDKVEIIQEIPEAKPKDTLKSYLTRLEKKMDTYHGYRKTNKRVYALLKEFFENYTGTLVFHNSPFDTKVLIYCLWMESLLDDKGLLEGLHVMYRSLEDTKVIAYLATNSTAGNKLSLKDLAQEFAGNWSEDNITDVRKIPLTQLLHYNVIDGLATYYVYDKYKPIMIADKQLRLYNQLMIPSQKVITQIELSGMPMLMSQVAKARTALEQELTTALEPVLKQPIIERLEEHLTHAAWQRDYESRREKAKNPDNILPKEKETFPKVNFNPNSNPQLQHLLYVLMGLPVIDRTDSKQPATGHDTLAKLINHTDNESYKTVIQGLMDYGKVVKILSAFIPAFERSILKEDGHHYLHGSFNLGGTVSGRLSSSDPNLQNIPSGSAYGKLVKECFQAPKGWIFCGADFNSLEDYISALTTRDPNKLKVYIDGYDGHCLRAYSYFKDEMPDISDALESINSIADKYPKIRQKSKGPTFCLTYQGTYIALMQQFGFSEEEAKNIEAMYHELYVVSDEWVQAKLEEAAKTGYVEVAFGLRVRTPLLSKTLTGRSTTPYEAEAEGRTAGNALGQSYGLLTNRACNAFMTRVWDSPYKYDIRPVAMIHDAIYLMIRDDIDVVTWVNRELIKAMEWQGLPEIQHDTVKIGAALDLFHPSWAHDITLPINATPEEIRKACKSN